MAYSKTTWVNGTTPAISAANLNKIEQGIYDATDDVKGVTEGKKTISLYDFGWQTGRINGSGVPYSGDGHSVITSDYIDFAPYTEIDIYDTKNLSGYGISIYKYNRSNKSYVGVDGTYMYNSFPKVYSINPNYVYKFEWRNASSNSPDASGLTADTVTRIEYIQDAAVDYMDENVAVLKSKNLINKQVVISGYYVDATNGTFKTNENFWRTPYIRIKPNTTYTLRYINQVAFYNELKHFISGVAGTSSSTSASASTFTSPANAKYIVVCGHNSQLDTDQLEEGSSFTSYSTYKKLISPDVIPPISEVTLPTDTIISEILQYATNTIHITLIGDSITHGVGGTGFAQDGDLIITHNGSYYRNPHGYCWANLLKAQLESEFNCAVLNNGIKGRTAGYFAECVSTLVPANSDIVICMLGTNNRGTQELAESFMADMQSIINYSLEIGALFIIMCPPPASATNESDKYIHIEDICHMIRALAKRNKFGCIDLFSKLYNFAWYRDIDFTTLLADGLHPNDDGYYILYRYIAECLGVSAKIEDATW